MRTGAVLALAAALLAGCGSRTDREALAARGVPYTPQGFIEHARAGDAEIVRQFLRGGMSPNVRDEDTRTALMGAAEHGHEAIVGMLVAAGAHINDRVARAHLIEIPFWTDPRKDEGCTALMFALRGQHKGVVRQLVTAGANVRDSDRRGSFSMVDLAIMTRDPEMVRVLVDAGAPVETRDNMGHSELFLAAQLGDAEMVRMLLARGAQVNMRSRIRPETPLVMAVQSGSAEVVELLLRAGAEPNVTDHFGKSPLVYADERRRGDLATLLREAGSRDSGVGESRLLAAVHDGDVAAVRELLRRGADADAHYRQQLMDRTALTSAVDRESLEMVSVLLEAGANPNATDAIGSTALHAAARVGNAEVVRALLRAGAKPSAADRNHWTPILQAAHSGHAEALRALVQGGADVEEATFDGKTPLMIAARGGDVMAREPMNVEAAQALLDLGAHIDATDARGNTALIEAVEMRRALMVACLLRARPNLGARNQRGQTALGLAVERRDPDIEQQLRQAGASQ